MSPPEDTFDPPRADDQSWRRNRPRGSAKKTNLNEKFFSEALIEKIFFKLIVTLKKSALKSKIVLQMRTLLFPILDQKVKIKIFDHLRFCPDQQKRTLKINLIPLFPCMTLMKTKKRLDRRAVTDFDVRTKNL